MRWPRDLVPRCDPKRLPQKVELSFWIGFGRIHPGIDPFRGKLIGHLVLKFTRVKTCWWVQWLILGLPLHFCAKNWKSSSLVPFRKSSLFFFRIFSKATWIPTRTQQFLKECWGGRGWLPFSNTGFVHSYFVMYRFSSSSAYKVHWTRLVVRPGHLPRSFPCFQPDELPQRLRCKIAWQRHEAPWHVHWISHWGVWWSVQLVSKRS